ncbi:MAG TPA: hypothetical protein VI488_09210, partial [Candidatus Angelobacter sp.]
MSIGVGFHCPCGIVLCADTQITYPANHKYYEKKIYLQAQGDWLAGFSYAGNPNLMKSFDGKFRDAMTVIPGPYTAAK